MVATGDAAPGFTAPLANGDVGEFSLDDRLGEAPLVLAFFPAAFTGTCSHEMSTFQERLGEFADAGATIYGISTDSPFALNEFRDKLGVEFDMISDANRELIDAYGVSMDFEQLGIEHIAQRAVFVVDGDGTITYAWSADDPTIEPDYDEILAAVREAGA
jgi:peroxiredoxin